MRDSYKDGVRERHLGCFVADASGIYVTLNQADPFMETPFSGTTSRRHGCAQPQHCWAVRMWRAAMLGWMVLLVA